MVVNSTAGARKRMLKGTNKQLTSMNQAMIEMLRGRAVRVAATIGAVGYAVEVRSAGVVRLGGGGVAECGMSTA